MRIGILGSSGGSALGAAADVLVAAGRLHEFVVATDRPCGLESVASRLGSRCVRFSDADDEAVSVGASEYFLAERAAFVILYYVRMIRPALFQAIPCFNIHPSLLPAFPGLSAVRRAREAGEVAVGATLHLVDATLDRGPIVAQTISAMAPHATEPEWAKRSFLQKVYLTLLLVELWERRALGVDPVRSLIRAAPVPDGSAGLALADPRLIRGFRALERAEGAELVI